MDSTSFITHGLYSKHPELCHLEADWHFAALTCNRQFMISGQYDKDYCELVMRHIEKVLSWVESNSVNENTKPVVAFLRYEAEKQYDTWKSRVGC